MKPGARGGCSGGAEGLGSFCVVVATMATVAAAVAGSAGAAGVPRRCGKALGDPSTSCRFRNRVKNVIEITFDDVHFFRDNPNVPSDLELMPHLLEFIERTPRCSRTITRCSARDAEDGRL